MLALAAEASGEPLMTRLPAASAEYARPLQAADASGRLSGWLHLEDESGARIRILRDNFAQGRRLAPMFRKDPLPDFSFQFQQVGHALVPVRRGVVEGRHPLWDLILQPGSLWADPGSHWNLGAVPFALQERNANCTHYGLLLFRYQPTGSTADAAWQIASETCAYFQFDGWGRARIRYEQGKVAGDDAIAAAFRREQRSDQTSRIEHLQQAHPALKPISLPDPVRQADLTVFGLSVDGRHYASSCPTRFGAHPYCETLPLPSYSLAKSLFGGLALMRAELLQPGTRQRKIAPLVPQCRDWGDVTLEHALDMTTGRYASQDYEADENGHATRRFLDAGDHATRAALACTSFPRREAPGRRWVYHTTDTYVLGAALASLSAPADIHRQLLVEPIWRKLALSPLSSYTRRTLDAVRQPLVGYGLTFQRGDLVRLAGFLQAGGSVNGIAQVHPGMLAAAMQRNPSDRGLQAGFPGFRYQNGFWARNVDAIVGCAHPIWVPFLSGYGGISLVLFPNGVSYYVVSDGFTYDWSKAAKLANSIRSLCSAAGGA